MLQSHQALAIYMEKNLDAFYGKMGHGILRYSPQKIACVIDSSHAGKNQQDITGIERDCPVVGSVEEAKKLGADVFILGIANPGGMILPEWMSDIESAISLGMCVINGMHEQLATKFQSLVAGQWIWDVRKEPEGLGINQANARHLQNKRILMIGTSMGIGKMTAGLEIFRSARKRNIQAEFIATGQTGITIMGRGVALDAVRVDYASAAIEAEIMKVQSADWIIIEGQGALIHPGSTANLPLIRGSCPTHFVLCHKAGMEYLDRVPWVKVPPLREYLALYEDLASACGTFERPRSSGICLNTSHLIESEAWDAIKRASDEVGLPCTDPVRFGAESIVDALNL